MEFSIAALVGSCAANLLIGATVFLRNPRSRTGITFGILTIFTALWSACNYLVEHNFSALSVNVVLNLLAYVFAMAAIICIVCFSYSFHPDKQSEKTLRYLIASFPLTLIFSGTELVRGTVTRDANGLVFTPGSLSAIYLLAIITYIVFAMMHLRRVAKQADAQVKNQVNTMIFGFFGTVILIAIVNGIIPLITDSFVTAKLGPICTLVMIYAFAYAIVKHRLFDIRLVVARSVAYGLLVATLALIYVGGIFAIAHVFATAGPSRSDIGPFISALIVLITAPFIKNFFDRVTNKIFYRDAYDAQIFLDQLNQTIVGNIEIGILLRHTATVIEENLKATCHIYVNETENTPSRIMGTSKMDLKPATFDLIKQELVTIPHKTVQTDTLEDHYAGLKKALELSEIAVISSLLTNYATRQQATAYLILGSKKSGSSFTKQDLRIIDIISDELLIAIQNALRFEEIQSFNITLQNRINDATAKLKRSNEKLKEMDSTKDEFISMASHQLRTPLTSVKGYLSMVLDGDAGEVTDQQQQLLKQAYVSSQRMVYLIADLLNVSRLKTGKFIIDATPTNLADMVESEIAQLEEVAKSRKLTLTFNKPSSFPVLMLDETKTRQVIMNFVDNAIYYTPSGGKIKIELRADRSSVYFMVKDNGLGVPKNEQAHLFSKFYRASNAQKARPDGTGLGLFMAKKVVNDQGGTILFESTQGKGSTFGFKFDKPDEPVSLKK